MKDLKKIKAMTVCGFDICDFKIKSLYGTENSEKLRTTLFDNYLEYDLPIYEGEMQEDEHYIVLDNTSYVYGDYSITAENGNLYIRGSYVSIQRAITNFFEILESANDSFALESGECIKGRIEVPSIPYKNKDELQKIFEFFHEDERLLCGQHLAGSVNLNGGIGDYTKAVGEGPSIMDIDMIAFRKTSAGELSRLFCQAVEYASKGGIITTMHHWLNPAHPESNTFRGYLDSIEDWDKVLTKGSALNEEWQKELNIGGKFLAALRDAGVSVVYRPLHEANGNWFWFCGMYSDVGVLKAEQLIDMWKYVYHYYTDELGLDNLLWSYSPNNCSRFNLILPVDYYYPGDEYCDMVGLDWYTNNNYEIDTETKCWDTMLKYGKPSGLCEWGIGGKVKAEDPSKQSEVFSCEDYVNNLERMKQEGKKIAFIELYAGVGGAPSYVGKGEALAKSPLIVSLEEMPAIIADILK